MAKVKVWQRHASPIFLFHLHSTTFCFGKRCKKNYHHPITIIATFSKLSSPPSPNVPAQMIRGGGQANTTINNRRGCERERDAWILTAQGEGGEGKGRRAGREIGLMDAGGEGSVFSRFQKRRPHAYACLSVVTLSAMLPVSTAKLLSTGADGDRKWNEKAGDATKMFYR